MSPMHTDEMEIDASLVERLLATQFPQWSELSIVPVNSSGTDNSIYRLGDDMAVRLPRIHWAVEQVDKQHEWLPKFAALLPLAIPEPLAKGAPAHGYPWHWSVYRWLDGEDATVAPITDLCAEANEIARFISALRRIDPGDGPAPGEHNFFRGVPLAARDARTREAIENLRSMLDADAVTRAWKAALNAPAWQGPPVWIHGDLQAGNLLIESGRVKAVIDFGGLGVGDPACDLMLAWTLFSGESRDAFRTALAVDDATWARGRGWALSVALIALAYYLETNPVVAHASRHAVDSVLAD